jgi:hypothetical protein
MCRYPEINIIDDRDLIYTKFLKIVKLLFHKNSLHKLHTQLLIFVIIQHPNFICV